MKIEFLPSDYVAPKTAGNFMKLKEGENKIRILSQPILGWEDWTPDKKPVRFKFNEKPNRPLDPKKPIRHFWAFIVWNYSEQRIQILQVTQATIRNSIEALYKDNDWGAPFFYDIKIIKTGEGTDTEYVVNPLPHKPVSDEIQNEFIAHPCYLEALYSNGDPFSSEWGTYTSGIFSQDQFIVGYSPDDGFITKDQAKELEESLNQCDVAYQKNFWKFFTDHFPKAEGFEHLPTSAYERIKKGIFKKRDEAAKVAIKETKAKQKIEEIPSVEGVTAMNLPWENVANE